MLLLAGCRQDMQDQPEDGFRSAAPISLPTIAARVRRCSTPWRAASCTKTATSTPAWCRAPNGYKQELDEMPPFPVTMEVLEARAGAVQHLLHALPLACGQRAGRDCAARLQAGRQSARPGAPVAAALALLLRDDARLRRHARLLGAACAGGSLGGRGLHSRAATEPGATTAADVPAGVQVQSLKRLGRRKKDIPSTRSRGRCRRRRCRPIRPIASEGTPGMAPAYPADPKISIPASKPAPAAQK